MTAAQLINNFHNEPVGAAYLIVACAHCRFDGNAISAHVSSQSTWREAAFAFAFALFVFAAAAGAAGAAAAAAAAAVCCCCCCCLLLLFLPVMSPFFRPELSLAYVPSILPCTRRAAPVWLSRAEQGPNHERVRPRPTRADCDQH